MADTPFSLLDRVTRLNQPADWSRLVELYTPLLRRWLHTQVPQQADIDDLVQDVLAVVVAKLPEFRHCGSEGAFRGWLRAIMAFRLKTFWRERLTTPVTASDGLFQRFLSDLEESDSELSKRWDEEHDRYIANRLLEQIRPEFTPSTWAAFHLYVINGVAPAVVAAELGISTNVVLISRSRILRRLREEANGLLDPDDALPTDKDGS